MHNSIDIENTKAYREALSAMIVVNPARETLYNASGNFNLLNFPDAYGGLTYEKNMRPGYINKQQKLMDFAGGGFVNDGEAVPIAANYTSTHNHTHYGVPAKTINDSFSFDFGLWKSGIGSEYKNDFLMTVYAYDSKGEKYRARLMATKYPDTGSYALYYTYHINIAKSDFDNFPNNERLYIGYLDCSDSYIYENDQIISCILNLRGCELNIVDPTMQGSEFSAEIKNADEIKGISKGTVIQYLGGYTGWMSTPRSFYIDEYPEIDYLTNHVILKASDQTTRMSDEAEELAMYRFYGSNIKKYVIADTLEKSIRSGLQTQARMRNYYEYQGTVNLPHEPNTIPDKIIIPDTSIRQQLSDANRWWNENDFVFRYVDAGFPRWIALEQHTENSIYNYERKVSCNLGKENKVIPKSMITEFKIQSEEKPKYYDMTTYYLTNDPPEAEAPEVSRLASYTNAVMDTEYHISIPEDKSDYNSFYAKKTSSSSEEHPLEYDRTNSSLTIYAPWDGPLYVYGEKLSKAVDYWNTVGGYNRDGMEAVDAREEYSFTYMRDSEEHTLRDEAFDKIVDTPNLKYTFRWRGDPRMQPMDVITANGIEMTVESLTLEHSEGGGFSSEVVARGGRW